MPFTITSRYGAMESFPNDADVTGIVEKLIRELETEQFEEPDDEHTQISVEHSDWALTVRVSGLMTLDDLSGITGNEDDVSGEEFHFRASSRAEAVDMLVKMARGQLDLVRAANWVSFKELAPHKQDLFRK